MLNSAIFNSGNLHVARNFLAHFISKHSTGVMLAGVVVGGVCLYAGIKHLFSNSTKPSVTPTILRIITHREQ